MTTAEPGPAGTRVDAARVWAGGVATALVVALVGLATVAAATLAFAASGDLSEQIVASAIAVALGIAPREGRGPQPGLA